MTMTSPRHNSTNTLLPDRLKLAAIEQTYPGWRVKGRGSMWTATRITNVTPQQAAAGLHRYIIQPSLDALAAVLCQQLLIAQMVGSV